MHRCWVAETAKSERIAEDEMTTERRTDALYGWPSVETPPYTSVVRPCRPKRIYIQHVDVSEPAPLQVINKTVLAWARLCG